MNQNDASKFVCGSYSKEVVVYNFYSLHEVALLKSYQYTVFMGAFFSLDNIIRSARAKF